MSSRSNDQGRAYEFICLHSLYDAINTIRPVQIIHNSSYEAAENAWNTLSGAEKTLYTLSAKSTISTIFAMEPNIVEVDDDILNLYIQTDQHGEIADVRDIIIQRKDIVWEIEQNLRHITKVKVFYPMDEPSKSPRQVFNKNVKIIIAILIFSSYKDM